MVADARPVDVRTLYRALGVDLHVDHDGEPLLAHRPVQARPASLAYPMRQFVRRRWPWLAAAAIFLATAGGFPTT